MSITFQQPALFPLGILVQYLAKDNNLSLKNQECILLKLRSLSRQFYVTFSCSDYWGLLLTKTSYKGNSENAMKEYFKITILVPEKNKFLSNEKNLEEYANKIKANSINAGYWRGSYKSFRISVGSYPEKECSLQKNWENLGSALASNSSLRRGGKDSNSSSFNFNDRSDINYDVESESPPPTLKAIDNVRKKRQKASIERLAMACVYIFSIIFGLYQMIKSSPISWVIDKKAYTVGETMFRSKAGFITSLILMIASPFFASLAVSFRDPRVITYSDK